jgi:hypothetical protein
MDTMTAASRQVSFRAIGWLAIMALLAIAILGPAARPAFADHTIDVQDTTLGNGFDNPCGEADALKINSGEIVEVTHTYNFGGGVTIELTPTFSGGGSALDSVTVGAISGGAFASIYVHAGDGTTLKLVEGLVVDDPDHAISFILFCVEESTTTTTSTETTDTTTDTTTTDTTTTGTTTTDTTTSETTTDTTTSETTTDTTTTDTTTETTTTDVSSTTSVNTTTTGSVSSTTGTGTITLPPTSTVDPASGSNSTLISFGLLLLAVGGLVLGLARPLATRKVDDR